MIWKTSEQFDLSQDLQSHFGDSLILAQQLANRGLLQKDEFNAFLDPKNYRQSSPFDFDDMQTCVNRIHQAIKKNELIGIWGDFDVDGQTSTAILVDGLRCFGARTCFHIPIRATESHGMDLAGFTSFLSRNKPGLIITCDTGISDHESIAYAREMGIDVIITDHHQLSPQTPPAFGIINPHLLPENHPLSFLAGVGVAFQLLRALDETFPDRAEINSYYDLVALGTVADLAEQKSENRFYTQMGLEQMNHNLRPALQSILQVSSSRDKTFTEITIGFTIAPRLNAAGRLSDANPNVEFLLAPDKASCLEIANTLEQLNAERKLSVQNVLYSAHEMIEKSPEIARQPVILLKNPRWEAGVLGIAAGKLTEIFNRPAILLREDDGILSGSARSVQGIDITAAIAKHNALLMNYGGHAMAGGLRISENNFISFSRGLRATVSRMIGKMEQPVLKIDHFIPFAFIKEKLSDELGFLAPFGPGNPQPIFASRNLKVQQFRKFGSNDQYAKLILQDINGDTQEVTCWEAIQEWKRDEQIDLAYKIVPNDFQANGKIALEYVDARPALLSAGTQPDLIKSQIKLTDFRFIQNPLQRLSEIKAQFPDLQIWFEGIHKPREINGLRSRCDLSPSSSLAILTAPADIHLLAELISKTTPQDLILFDIYQPLLDLQSLLLQVGKLIKHYLNQESIIVSLDQFAARLNMPIKAIHLGIEWFQFHGDIQIIDATAEIVHIERKKAPADHSKLTSIQQNLNIILKEQSAFKDYYRRVDPQLLLRKNLQ
jgi:single-stranded-DNA-specific exonuclease